MQTKKHILLTGAGFTRNFGAPLASEMWSFIYSHPVLSECPEIRQVLRDDFEFESVYQKVMDEPFSIRDKQAMDQAVRYAYAHIDRIIEHLRDSDVAIPNVETMISRFAGYRHCPGFVFTLNQDLYLERHYYNGPRPALPGITRRLEQQWFTGLFNGPFTSDNVGQIADSLPDALDLLRGLEFNYIKLHGSMNWYGNLKDGTGQKMIIGRGKKERINGEPLLARYLQIFEDVLCSGEHKLLVIGYGFGDSHINEILLKAKEKGLLLYILQPGSPERLKATMERNECGDLWSALAGHFPYDLKTVFPAGQEVTREASSRQWRQIQDVFFDDRHGIGG